jgi:hypothetical protein
VSGAFKHSPGCTCCQCPVQVCFQPACYVPTTFGLRVYPQTGVLSSLANAGGTVIGTCTTNVYGGCCVTATTAGTYNYTLSKSGYTTATGTLNVTCNHNYAVRPTLCRTTISMVVSVRSVRGCPIEGAAVAITGTATGSGTTDATGNVTVSLSLSLTGACLTTGFTVTVTAPTCKGMEPTTVVSVAASNLCQDGTISADVTIQPDSDHWTTWWGGAYLPKQLTYTDTNGTCTITDPSGDGFYYGTYTFSNPDAAVLTDCGGIPI